MRTRLAQLGAAAALLVTAVAVPAGLRPETAAAQPAGVTQVPIIMGDYYFSPSAITVKVNEPIQFVLPNLGTERHRVLFQIEGAADRVRSDEDAGLGEIVVLNQTFTVPGVYRMWCSFATDGVSHRDLGMNGTLTVVE